MRIPIAPTRSEIAPIPATAALTTAKTRPKESSISPCVMTVKSSSPPCRAASTRFTPATTGSVRRPGEKRASISITCAWSKSCWAEATGT
ncbi:MAG: hypothetical protein IPL90_03305 [Holophagales bacterium]|nr:hypothetical protein [Holophagales bacterium]